MTVGELEAKMSAHEYVQWVALQKLENERRERAEKRAKSRIGVRKRR
jgi:hypothetical protein